MGYTVNEAELGGEAGAQETVEENRIKMWEIKTEKSGQMAENCNSKLRILIVFRFSLLACFALSGFGMAIENSVGSATTVASNVRSGLVRSVNPINSTSGLVVTGNVGGGRHFRGVVPYNAISDFGGTLGSSSLDSFLRRSGSGYYGIYTGRGTPYYSQTGTVTTTRAGRSGVSRPPAAEMGGRGAAGRFAPDAWLGGQVLPDSEGAGASERLRGLELGAAPEPVRDFWGSPAASRKMGTRPMSMSLQEMEKMILAEADAYQQSRKLAAEQFQAKREQFEQRLGQVGEEVLELKKGLTGGDEPLGSSTTGAVSWEAAQPFELREPAEKAEEKDKRLDVYEQMERQLDTQLPSSIGIEQPTPSVRERGATVADEIQEAEVDYKAEGVNRPSGVSLSIARARRILGSHESFADFSKDKFNQYILAAESYLGQGRYYRAADAYTLALVYRPEDPLAYAGKGHALFAAGEYMSSALFLSRALEIFPGFLSCKTGQSGVPPEYARFKIDIEQMVGDRDKLESRIVDVEQLLSRKGRLPAEASESGELEFLLGYVYYQMGRLERAKTAIEAAYEKMPEAPAVIALKQTIDGVALKEHGVK